MKPTESEITQYVKSRGGITTVGHITRDYQHSATGEDIREIVDQAKELSRFRVPTRGRPAEAVIHRDEIERVLAPKGLVVKKEGEESPSDSPITDTTKHTSSSSYFNSPSESTPEQKSTADILQFNESHSRRVKRAISIS